MSGASDAPQKENTMKISTIKNLTDNQIRAMQSEAETECEYVMAAICDLAIIGTFDANDWSTLTHQEQVRVGKMTREDAYAVIVDAINLEA